MLLSFHVNHQIREGFAVQSVAGIPSVSEVLLQLSLQLGKLLKFNCTICIRAYMLLLYIIILAVFKFISCKDPWRRCWYLLWIGTQHGEEIPKIPAHVHPPQAGLIQFEKHFIER